MAGQPEAVSRVLIDQALKDSGWNLLDRQQVRLELSGDGGRSDYVLSGPHGPLCVLEAKKHDDDPYDAKEQARGYAENLRAPFVILSNGTVHWFWNLQRADVEDAYRIERLPSPEDLEYLRLKNLNPPRPLMTEVLGPDYIRRFRPDLKLRGYQIRAIDRLSLNLRVRFLNPSQQSGPKTTAATIHSHPDAPCPPGCLPLGYCSRTHPLPPGEG